MELGLRGRVAIVCAASQGLGKAAAIGLAREGASVVICSRNRRVLAQAAEDIREQSGGPPAEIVPVVADLTKPRQITALVARTVKRFGRIDILVANAGGPPVATFPALDDRKWEEGVALTLMSAIRCIRAVLPHMQKRQWGRIITITSIAARQPINDLVISSTLRPGLHGLTRVLANQYGKEGILINAVAPGFMLTGRMKEIGAARAAGQHSSPEEYFAQQSRDVPLQRYGNPEELANAIVFLASEKASYITGATLSVDGGLMKGVF
jgi:3-oxoacyl-[acyl-carrier protein] reductase